MNGRLMKVRNLKRKTHEFGSGGSTESVSDPDLILILVVKMRGLSLAKYIPQWESEKKLGIWEGKGNREGKVTWSNSRKCEREFGGGKMRKSTGNQGNIPCFEGT